jgi:hypothetical protein
MRKKSIYPPHWKRLPMRVKTPPPLWKNRLFKKNGKKRRRRNPEVIINLIGINRTKKPIPISPRKKNDFLGPKQLPDRQLFYFISVGKQPPI